MNHLNHEIKGEGAPIAITHGLFGSLSNWRPIATQLAKTNQTISIDAPNHGSSDWSTDMSYPATAEDLFQLAQSLKLLPFTALGHSMGGKSMLALSLEFPEIVNKLVLVDIAPLTYSAEEHLNLINSLEQLDLCTITKREQADQQLAESISNSSLRQFLLQNLVPNPDKNPNYQWRINLEQIKHSLDDIRSWPTDLETKQFNKPALLVRGGNSQYVTDETIELTKKTLPQLQTETIPNTGHWLHAEAPNEFLEILHNFLDS